VKRTKSSQNKKRKVSERLIPVVDEVVEMVFARLKEAAARARKPTRKKSSARSKGAAVHSSIAVNRDGSRGGGGPLVDLATSPESQPARRGRSAASAHAESRRS
jgi:hypothetical protein